VGKPSAFVGGRDATQLTNQLLTLLRGCQTELILVDEISHIVDGRRNDSLGDVADWLKDLADKSRAPLVLAGLPHSQELMRGNEALRRRFSAGIELSVTSLADHRPNLKDFQSVLKSIEGHLPLQPGSLLYGKEIARRLLFACEGRIGQLMALIHRAVRICKRMDRGFIDLGILELAFKRELWKAAPSIRNPFSADFNGARLIGRNEPFEPASSSVRRRAR